MKRLQCSNCSYPLSTCVCQYLKEPIKNRTKIIILQHPDETGLAKNTARLLTLQLDNIEIFVGESQQDFQSLQSKLDLATSALLYPSENAVTTDSLSSSKHKINTLLVIDGTWKKTNKILALNTWLKQLVAVSFKDIPKNKYTIRKAEQTYSLSTLEAVGLFLEHQEYIDSYPLLSLLDGMIKEQTKFMSAHVKARYQR
jgi:DTW domain-containing protein YfiP